MPQQFVCDFGFVCVCVCVLNAVLICCCFWCVCVWNMFLMVWNLVCNMFFCVEYVWLVYFWPIFGVESGVEGVGWVSGG